MTTSEVLDKILSDPQFDPVKELLLKYEPILRRMGEEQLWHFAEKFLFGSELNTLGAYTLLVELMTDEELATEAKESSLFLKELVQKNAKEKAVLLELFKTLAKVLLGAVLTAM